MKSRVGLAKYQHAILGHQIIRSDQLFNRHIKNDQFIAVGFSQRVKGKWKIGLSQILPHAILGRQIIRND